MKVLAPSSVFKNCISLTPFSLFHILSFYLCTRLLTIPLSRMNTWDKNYHLNLHKKITEIKITDIEELHTLPTFNLTYGLIDERINKSS